MQDNNQYVDIFLAPIQKCREYRPKFGESRNEYGVLLEGFLELYGNDPFYSWIGLDSSLMYAAHKAADGMTSIYRQIGIGCEHLFREIIVDTAQYKDKDFALWSYETKTQSGKTKTLTLDGRLELKEIQNLELKNRLQNWIIACCKDLSVTQIPQNGVDFEVRQGYKSKGSKRQNADIDNATVAYSNGYLPVFAIFSSQIDSDIVLRYRNNRCGLITGINSDNPQTSLFTFCKTILGYDLAAFFKNNSEKFKLEINSVLKTLLDAN
ncbi:MAG: hypothetical protein LBS01_03900 [Prevotellaceae bacterium]|jgi:hypothetical protein|nr:hypothetical protein [Prevotellaceae bacterium]